MAKKRTEAKVRNGIISCMRRNFAQNSPKYEQVVKSCRVERVKLKLDGTPHKVPEVWYVCMECKTEHKSLEVDHADPVVPVGQTGPSMSLDVIYERLNCDVSNLKAICKDCHSAKTKRENALRKAAKK